MSRWLKLTGRVIGVLLLVVVVAALTGYAVTERRIHAQYSVALTPVPVSQDSATVARGKHLVMAVGKCAECHQENMSGMVVIDDKAFGHLSSSNLTSGRGGVLPQYTDAELARVIRRGVKRDGTSLLFMPSTDFARFTDADVGAMISYLRSLPPVDHIRDAQVLGPIARILILGGKTPVVLPASHMTDVTSRAPVPPGATVAYGEYLAHVGGCYGCHGDRLTGGPVPGAPPQWPPAKNITPAGIGAWTDADFMRALREGKRPNGTAINPVMPWRYTRLLTDDEIRALWLYLQTVPAISSKVTS